MKDIKGANTVYLLIVAASILFTALASVLALFNIDIFGGSFAFQLIISQVIFASPVALYMIFCSKSTTVLRFNKISFVNILLTIVLYICLNPVLNFLSMVSMLYSSNAIASVMLGVSDEMPFVVGLFLIAILPAFCEELCYRGFFYNTYRQYSGFGAVLLSGVLFGLTHGNFNQFTYAVVFGICFALIVEATDSIWSTIVIHTLVNGVSCVSIYVMPKLFTLLQQLYNTAMAEGDTMTMELITQFAGTDDLSVEGFMDIATGSLSKAEILMSIKSSAVPALIGAILAFFLYRCIAVRCGRWEHIKAMFTRKSRRVNDTESDQLSTDTAVPEVPLKPVKVKFFTWQLVAAMVVMVLEMVVNEVALRVLAG